MGNKITTIVTTVITLLIFMVVVAFISTDSQIDQSKQIIKSLSEEVQYKGYITYDQYMAALEAIPFRNAKIELTQIRYDGDNTYKPGTLDMTFTTQIMGSATNKGEQISTLPDGAPIYSGTLLYESIGTDDADCDGIYKFEIGDQIKIDLIVLDRTFFDGVLGVITGKGTSNIRILTSESGTILNEKY